MSDTEKPSWEWRALAQDLQTANEWLAKRVDELQQLAQKVTQELYECERKYELVRHDQDYHQCCELRRLAEQQRDTAHSHLEAQRTATYQAVAREHTAKQQLATVTQERDELRLRSKAVDARQKQLVADRRKMMQEYEAWCLEDV